MKYIIRSTPASNLSIFSFVLVNLKKINMMKTSMSRDEKLISPLLIFIGWIIEVTPSTIVEFATTLPTTSPNTSC